MSKFAVLLAGALLSVAAQGQTAFVPQRLSDGITPDFRGIWEIQGTADVNIEGHPAQKGLAAGKSIVVDPANGKIPYLPSALPQRAANFQNRATADPSSKCFQAGVPRAIYLPHPLQIIQSPGNFALAYQDVHTYRIIHLDGRPHFDRIDWWMGDSRGRWERDSLVVDVRDLNDQTWFDQAGNHHSEDMQVLERYTLTGPDTLLYEATMTDPKTFSQPWKIRVSLRRHKEAGFRIIEDECADDGKNGRYHVSPITSR